MISSVLLICFFGGLVSSAPRYYDPEDADTHFEYFMKTYNKVYLSEEEKQMRFEIFKSNLALVNERNRRENSDVHGITMFLDLTEEEFKSMYTGFIPSEAPVDCPCKAFNFTSFTAPDRFDWRDKGVVSAVKSQGGCGSCWAFSTTGNVESQYAMKHGQIVQLSEQQFVDCDTSNQACLGGLPSKAMLYAKAAGGIMSEQGYPYTAVQGSCSFQPSQVVVKVAGCNQFNFNSEEELKEALARVGPISILLCANGFNTYHGGIFNCQGNCLDHAVLLVGYGEENGTPYWIIKNSYSATWGESGYIRIKRNINACGLLNQYMASAIVE